MHTKSEKASESLAGMTEGIYLLKSVSKEEEMTCYFKYEDNNSDL